MWTYVHLLTLPGIINDLLYHRLYIGTHSCGFNVPAQLAWAIAIQLLLYDSPILTIMVIFTILVCKTGKTRVAQTRSRFERSRTDERSVEHRTNDPENSTRRSANAESTKERQLNQSNRALVLLASLTASSVICWTPGAMYFTILLFKPSAQVPVQLQQIGNFLWSIQPLTDASLFILAFKDLRTLVKQILTCSYKG